MSTRRAVPIGIALVLAAVIGTVAWLAFEEDDGTRASNDRHRRGSSVDETRLSGRTASRDVISSPYRAARPSEPRAASKIIGEVARAYQWGSDPAELAPGILTSTDLFETDKPAMAAMQEAFGPYAAVNGDADDCLRRWTSRGGKLGANYDWDFVLHVVSDGERGRVVEVSSENWPDAFDASLRDCYRRAYSRVEFEVAHEFDYRVSYPMCLKNGG